MKQHRAPSARTVKELYGNAISCAFPDCRAPLYLPSADGSARTLNSEVAHICARSEDGPRWRPMGEAENAGFANLLLLFHQHHSEVDSVDNVSNYPEALLIAWKAEQVRKSRPGAHGR